MPEPLVVRCEICGAEVSAQGRFCSSCGARLVSDDLPTFSSPQRAHGRTTTRGPGRGESPAAAGEAGLLPGTLLAGRYRVVALLGRGGMGEVYRADDLTLGQPVALKFLPRAADNEEMLARFRSEVRIARRVSHANVCRVYDVGEAAGRHFLSMEYVDGEDLASLLRRIGRLPPDKAVEVARRVCAGLAAAHAKGVLHRDLKPANVMLDNRGQILITDFGLAAVTGEVPEGDESSGTPAYMAPEQLEGREVTVRSDIYALGLVLYEIFTGRRAFEGRTRAEVTLHRSDPPSSPSQIIKDLDPAVERVILRCLERDPGERPASVLSVAAALPGGDPLAAALAAGETPAPEVVADAGGSRGLTPRAAVASLATAVLGLTVILALSVRGSGLDRVGALPPQALAEKAREVLRQAGYTEPPVDHAEGFAFNDDLEKALEKETGSRPDWQTVLAGRPALLTYWYRTSPRPLTTTTILSDLMTPGLVTPTHPPTTVSGMVNLTLDTQGRLQWLQALPPEREEPPKPPVSVDWRPLWAAAGLDPATFRPAEPTWVSLAASDQRAAWTGTWPGTDRPLRVEAAAFHGKPVFFALIGRWTKPRRVVSDEDAGEKASGILMVLLACALLGGGVVFARVNWVRGKGDRRGAFRLAQFVFAAMIALWILLGHHFPGIGTFGLFLLSVARALFLGAVIWVLYLAVEPYVRKHWPQAIISWSRLLAGRFRDSLLGRDLLSGVLLGMLWATILETALVIIQRMGASPTLGATDYLLGGRAVAGTWLGMVVRSIWGTLSFFFLLFLLRVVLRRPWLAAMAFIALMTAMQVLNNPYKLVTIPAMVAVYSVAVVALMRFGLVTLAAGLWTANLLLSVPVTASLSSWYVGAPAFVYLSILALAVFGFWISLGEQRLWKDELFE